MEEIDTERQRHILENIQAERAADILQAMEPDEAADLLAQLPEERAQELLGLMNPEESEDVQELLEYEEDTAGGLMTTDYIALNNGKKRAEALDAVRSCMQEQDIRTAYIYCVADETEDELVIGRCLNLGPARSPACAVFARTDEDRFNYRAARYRPGHSGADHGQVQPACCARRKLRRASRRRRHC